MDPLLLNAISYGVFFLLIVIFSCILVLVGRKCSVISTFALYCFLSSVLIVVNANGWYEYLNFVEGIGTAVSNFCYTFSLLFNALYYYFINLIISLCSLFMDTTAMYDFLNTNVIFFIAFHFVLFILCLIMFRKKNKAKIERSRYCD